MKEIIVDNFAGGGGASTGIELAIGKSVDIAINHDKEAIRLHKMNHPDTKHYCESVWDVDPIEACKGRPVGLAWFSPDCKHFSKAKGKKPVNKSIRALAWIMLKWAIKVGPRVMMLENVEEFKTWGPLIENEDGDWIPDPKRKGETFQAFNQALTTGLPIDHPAYDEICEYLEIEMNSSEVALIEKGLGYQLEYRELRACDYGAPTTRKRFFMIARSDSKRIVWPKATHGDPDSLEVISGMLEPWRSAGSIIDWSIPCPSIFERKKPLADNTLKRIARGYQKFVLENANPYIVRIGQTGYGKDRMSYPLEKPLTTITTKQEHLLVTPYLIRYNTETSKDEVRGQTLDEPVSTLDTSNRLGLITAFIKIDFKSSVGSSLEKPLGAVMTVPKSTLVSAFLVKHYGGNYQGAGIDLNEPTHTVTTVDHHALVTAFLIKYYGADVGQDINRPLNTITTKDRFGLVTIKGEDYRVVDIGMRMLQPRELYNAQGFPEDYIIEFSSDGKKYTKKQMVAKCGNAVPPDFSRALVEVNLPEYCESQMDIAM